MDDSLLESPFEDDESDFDVPARAPAKAVKTKAAPKKAAAKPKALKETKAPQAAPKKLAQTKLNMTSKSAPSKKRAKPESDEENSDLDLDHNSDHDASLLSNTPPSAKKLKKNPAPKKSSGKPLRTVENESFAAAADEEEAPKPKGKAGPTNASQKYQKISHVEHILIRPDTYIGSVEMTDKEMWVYNTEKDLIEFRQVNYVPGLYKIFDEVLVNAADNKQNDKNMDEIKVTVDRESGEISVWNNGKGIPIEMHATEGMYIPEMIFGHLLSSSNYDDAQDKVTGGRNGYGAKLCNIFSTEFTVETADSKQKKKYKQTWTKNMSVKAKPKITDNKGDDYTKVTFTPDYSKFNMAGMDDDFEALVKRRIYDMAGTLKDVKIKLNGDRIKCSNFKKYMELYTKSLQAEAAESGDIVSEKQVIITDKPHDRWEIGFAVSDGSFKQVSFVNSIATTSGGTHIKYVSDQITSKLIEIIKKKNKKGVALKPAQIQNHMFLFVNCQIVNPAFTSQTKEQLTTKAAQFGSKFHVSDKFLDQIAKSEIVTNIMHFADKKADQLLAKSDGSKRARMNNSKLTDANKAGTKDGWKCTLILTEGDSASGLALAGRAVVNPDLIGVFPLRGKLLNVRDATVAQISNNAEIQNIKKFMGLQHKKEYTDTKSLRYGHLMIMTDQDHDGSHIKGLLINFLEAHYPSLLKIPDFLNVFITPIVKVWKGDPKHPKQLKSFFTMPEYEAWKSQVQGEKGWDHKYYKGLGTSSTEDAEIYFRDLDLHLKEFDPMKKEEAEMIDLAFSKKKADARKNWLREFVPGTFLDMSAKQISYNDFVNKELILFSMADNLRSIPSVVDGLKPSQRKVLYTCFKRNLRKDMKVVELSGMVSGMTNYSYGETSLQQTIVGLAQTFVGSNNINCLEPSGNFGSRRMGGQDAASARYIYTRLSPFARKIFSQTDEALLTYHEDDGSQIEPVNYVPIVPLLLLNGADGIGTGWSTSIPNYRPEDIVENLKLRMAGDSKESMKPMEPWFRGFCGTTEGIGNDRWKFSGIIQQTGDNEVEITELPVRMWTQDFKDKLEDIIKAEKTPSFIKDYMEYNTPTKVHFIIKMEDKHMKTALEKGLEDTFKITKTMATSNLVAFDGQGRIHKYETAHLLSEMHRDLDRMTNQARFIKMIIEGDLVVSKKKKTILMAELKKLNFKPFPKVEDASKAAETERALEGTDDDDETVGGLDVGARDYDYLLGMAIWSLTQERVDKIMKNIGDKEVEIDTLVKLSSKDLWTRDLDAFLEEWHRQLEDEKTRKKKIAGISRRASAKLGISVKGGRKKKRYGSDDDSSNDEFTVTKKRGPKSVMDRVKPKAPSTLMSFFNNQPTAAAPQQAVDKKASAPRPASKSKSKSPIDIDDDDDDFMETDAPEVVAAKRPPPVVAKVKAAPVAKLTSKPKKIVDLSDDDEDDVFAAVAEEAKTMKLVEPLPSRAARAKKAAKYVHDDSDSDSNGDDMLGDVSMMVKGIGGTDGGASSRPLFTATTARPGSGHGLPKPKSRSRSISDDDGIDDTDYTRLIPQDSPRRPAARNANDTMALDGEEEEGSFDLPPIKAASKAKLAPKAATKTITKRTAAPKAKVVPAMAAAAKKVMPLSPAAKAYAKKLEKTKAGRPSKKVYKSHSEEEEDQDGEVNKLADHLLGEEDDDMDDEVAVPVTRPSRRAAVAAVTKTKKYVVSDDEESEEEETEMTFGDDDSD
ncbi:DNA topoisomerase 2 [Venturia effusa]|uniref:DNA topoisomerase 2 n=1 Tax=Venturia effusa TaxID=50376 RepID=A0A517LBP6_9PEZI|nr:DNA topoisomerase 2 [Venturia effusa]